MDQSDIGTAARAGGIVFVGKLFTWGMRLVLAVLLARLLGASDYGLYTIALSVVAVASALSVFGLDAAMIRFVAIAVARGDEARARGTAQVGIAIPAFLSCLVATGVAIAAEPLAVSVIGEPDLAPVLRVGAVLVPAMVANSLLTATLQGVRHIGQAVVAEQFVQPVLRAAILVVFAVVGLTAELAVVATLVSTVGVGLLMAWYVHRSLTWTGSAARPTKEIVRFSLPVYFSNIVNTFGGNLQTLLLGGLSSVASAGVFAVANQLQLIGSLFHMAIVRSTMPAFAELHDAGERRRLEDLYQTTSKWTFSLNLPFFLVSLGFAPALMLVFGPEFTSGADALVVLAAGTLVSSATGTSGAMLDMTGHTAMKLVNSTLSVGLAIVLNLALIPSYGVLGAAIASAAGVTAVNVLRVVELAWLENVQPYNGAYLKPIASGVVAMAIGWAAGRAASLWFPLAIHGAVGAAITVLVYGLLLVGLGITPDERAMLRRAVQRLRGRRARRGHMAADAP